MATQHAHYTDVRIASSAHESSTIIHHEEVPAASEANDYGDDGVVLQSTIEHDGDADSSLLPDRNMDTAAKAINILNDKEE